MAPSTIDPSLYYQLEDFQLVVINGSYVDDPLRSGMDEWKTYSDATLELLETTANQQTQNTPAGMHITESNNM